MGISKKHHQMDACKDSDGKKWLIAGIAARAPLKPISTKSREDNEDDGSRSTTPTSREYKIPKKLACPPAPRKPRPASAGCHFSGVREFFNPPDLESVFICQR